jgi:DNA-binding IclR family transcriptional regulator
MALHNVKPTAYPGTQAALRAVRLLRSFDRPEPTQRLSELASGVGLYKTTANRILTALESEGLIERSGEAYRLGPEIVALAARAMGSSDLRASARSELVALAHRTSETATLEVRAGSEVLILDEAMGPHVVGAMPSVGTRWPLHATSTGKVLLAFLPEDERDAALPSPLTAVGPKTITEAATLRRELQRVAERGTAVSVEELEAGFVAVAAPIRGADGAVTAAISVGGPKARLSAERLTEIVAQVPASAARIARRLGHVSAEDRRGR